MENNYTQTIKAIRRAAKNARKEIPDNIKLIRVLSILDDVEKLVKEGNHVSVSKDTP